MKHHLKKHLSAVLAGNGNLGELVAKYQKEVTYPTCRQLMVEIVLKELLGLVEVAPNLEMSPDVLKEFAALNRALLKFLGEIGASGVYEPLSDYTAAIKKISGCGDLWVLACRTLGICQRREFSLERPY